jgi:hypothetical protein
MPGTVGVKNVSHEGVAIPAFRAGELPKIGCGKSVRSHDSIPF